MIKSSLCRDSRDAFKILTLRRSLCIFLLPPLKASMISNLFIKNYKFTSRHLQRGIGSGQPKQLREIRKIPVENSIANLLRLYFSVKFMFLEDFFNSSDFQRVLMNIIVQTFFHLVFIKFEIVIVLRIEHFDQLLLAIFHDLLVFREKYPQPFNSQIIRRFFIIQGIKKFFFRNLWLFQLGVVHYRFIDGLMNAFSEAFGLAPMSRDDTDLRLRLLLQIGCTHCTWLGVFLEHFFLSF